MSDMTCPYCYHEIEGFMFDDDGFAICPYCERIVEHFSGIHEARADEDV